MMFSGNPGTAKTTVARLLTKILKDENAIESGRFVECGRQDLVGKYVGYPDKMQEFLEQNEGLKSRIAFHLDFPDYTADELSKIISLMSKNREYKIDEDALVYCKEIFESAASEENFGNGRYARNVLEQAILSQSNRIVNEAVDKDITRDDICLLIKVDFKMVSQKKKQEVKKIGFAC